MFSGKAGRLQKAAVVQSSLWGLQKLLSVLIHLLFGLKDAVGGLRLLLWATDNRGLQGPLGNLSSWRRGTREGPPLGQPWALTGPEDRGI